MLLPILYPRSLVAVGSLVSSPDGPGTSTGGPDRGGGYLWRGGGATLAAALSLP